MSNLMNRREALARLTLLMGGAIIGSEAFLRGAPAGEKATGTVMFTPGEITLLDEIGETIIPTTSSPGAKAANIGAFMAMMVNDCYDPANQAIFRAGLPKLEAASQQLNGKSFLASTPAERTALLSKLDAESRVQAKLGKDAPAHYFRQLKQLTLLGYFTSEIGCTKALRYVETPGSYNGNLAYKKGDKAFFTPPSRSAL